MSMTGYQNNVLRIDLTEKNFTTEPLRMDWAEKYIGGKGLLARYLYDEIEASADPLGPENKLIFMTSPIAGTTVPCSGKLELGAKSPASGTINDCSMGGHACNRIKLAGYDAVIFEGASDTPVMVVIEDEKVEIVNAQEYWGKGSHDTETLLIEKYGLDYSIISIGPAGEKLSAMACINSDYYRQAGRGGLGAVMGSKCLKAVIVKGTKGLSIPNIEKTADRLAEILKTDTINNAGVWKLGTAMYLEACNAGGILPLKNFQDTTDEKWAAMGANEFIQHKQGKRGCGSCGIGCGNFLKVGNIVCEGPEYETISVAGPNAGVYDPVIAIRFNNVCDNIGVDTISAGDAIIWAMEMTEKGIHDFGIRFGDGEGMIRIVEEMGQRTGVGGELMDGLKVASEKYGGAEFAMQVKNLEYPQYEPRGAWGTALAYAVSDRGACHMRAYPPKVEIFGKLMPPYTPEGKGKLTYDLYVANCWKFSFAVCSFWSTLTAETTAEILSMITGKEWTEDEIIESGKRTLNICRAFNQREGFNRLHDTVPNRILNEALKTGPAAGQVITEDAFNQMLDDYYAAAGWDKNGMMPEELIQSLL